MSSSIKQALRPFIPLGVTDMRRRYLESRFEALEVVRRRRYDAMRSNVHQAVETIRSLDAARIRDVQFLEHELIPALGLNDDNLREQPEELSPFFGTGIHIFQYPSQLSRYLAWLADNATDVASYLEIGVRWGGTFILTSEWLRRIGARLQTVMAMDPIDPSPFVDEYFKILESEGEIRGRYVQAFSTSPEAQAAVSEERPDMTLIDGDHSLRGALADHVMVRSHAKVIAHHDIASDACPDTTELWAMLEEIEKDSFESVAFRDQYASVRGSFLGIGALRRRPTAV